MTVLWAVVITFILHSAQISNDSHSSICRLSWELFRVKQILQDFLFQFVCFLLCTYK